MKKRYKGFTMIELLAVIAIIGILVVVLVPAVGYARRMVRVSTTRAMFTSWITAIEQYKITYRHYPIIDSATTATKDVHYKLSTGTNSLNFVKALSGRNPNDGSALVTADKKKFNKRGQEFCSFSTDNFVTTDAGGIDKTKWQLQDSFLNPNIHLVMDIDDNGRIVLPTDALPNDVSDDEKATDGILIKVAIYTLKKDATANESFEDVLSWR